jgi:hypothetical protein
VSRRNISDTYATPSGIKREWYVCMYVPSHLIPNRGLKIDILKIIAFLNLNMRSSMAPQSMRLGVQSWKFSNVG